MPRSNTPEWMLDIDKYIERADNDSPYGDAFMYWLNEREIGSHSMSTLDEYVQIAEMHARIERAESVRDLLAQFAAELRATNGAF